MKNFFKNIWAKIQSWGVSSKTEKKNILGVAISATEFVVGTVIVGIPVATVKVIWLTITDPGKAWYEVKYQATRLAAAMGGLAGVYNEEQCAYNGRSLGSQLNFERGLSMGYLMFISMLCGMVFAPLWPIEARLSTRRRSSL